MSNSSKRIEDQKHYWYASPWILRYNNQMQHLKVCRKSPQIGWTIMNVQFFLFFFWRVVSCDWFLSQASQKRSWFSSSHSNFLIPSIKSKKYHNWQVNIGWSVTCEAHTLQVGLHSIPFWTLLQQFITKGNHPFQSE